MENKKNLIEHILFVGLDKCFTLIFLIIFASYLFLNHSLFEFSLVFMIGAFLTVSLVAILLNHFSIKYINNNDILKKYMIENNKRVLLMFFLLLFLIQSIISWQVVIKFNWDAGIIFDTVVSETFQPVFTPYFSYFPNNSVLVFGMRFLYEFLRDNFHIEPMLFYKIIMIVNIALVDLGLMFGFKITEKLFNLKKAYQYLLLITLFFGISPWIMVVYSDTLSIPFTTGVLLIILKIRESKSFKKQFILSILLGIILFLGYAIRPSSLIVLIAVVIIATIRNIRLIKKLIIYGLALVTAISVFFVVRSSWNYYLYEVQDKMEISEDVAFPWTYWVATGLNEPYGVCTQEDQWATIYRESSDRMYELHKEMIVERLSDKGVGGYGLFLLNKLQWITSEGFFFWGEEGGKPAFADYELMGNDIISQTIYYEGDYHHIFQFYFQGLWGVILLCVAIPFKRKNTDNIEKISIALLQTIITGIICYILLLEGRPRYFIQYIPFFVMLAVINFDKIEMCLNKIVNKHDGKVIMDAEK